MKLTRKWLAAVLSGAFALSMTAGIIQAPALRASAAAGQFIGQDFESATVGWTMTELKENGIAKTDDAYIQTNDCSFTIADNPLSSGKALEIKANRELAYTFQAVAMTPQAGAADADAFAVRIKTPAGAGLLSTHFLLKEDDGELYQSSEAGYASPVTVLLVDAATGGYERAVLTGSNLCLPAGFDGWAVYPKAYFVIHPAYPQGNGVLNPDKVNEMQMLLVSPAVNSAYLLDTLSFVKTADFLQSLRAYDAEDAGAAMFVGQDFADTQTGYDAAKLRDHGTLATEGAYFEDMAYQIVKEPLPTGKQLKITVAKDYPYSFQILNLDFKGADTSAANSLVVRVKTPASETPLKVGFLLREKDGGELFQGSEGGYANPVTVTLADASTNRYTTVELKDNDYFLPGGFDGWIVIPQDYFTYHPAYPVEGGNQALDFGQVNQMWMLFSGQTVGDAYVLDNIGLTADTAAFLESIGSKPVAEPPAADFIVGQDFSAAQTGWDMTKLKEAGISLTDDAYIKTNDCAMEIVDGPLPDGHSLKITNLIPPDAERRYTFQAVSLNPAGAVGAAADAVVLRIQTPAADTVLRTSFLVKEASGELYQSSESGYDAPVPVILADSTTDTYRTVKLKAGNFFLPGGFDGWVVLPASYFKLHPAYTQDNGTLDFGELTQFWVFFDQAEKDSVYYLDNIGVTGDTAAFLKSIGSEEKQDEPEPDVKYYSVGQDFSGAAAGADLTAMMNAGIVHNFDGGAYIGRGDFAYEAVDGALGHGMALKLTNTKTCDYSLHGVNLDFSGQNVGGAKAVALRVKTPAMSGTGANAGLAFMLREASGEMFQGRPSYANNPVTLTYVDAKTNQYTKVEHSGTEYVVPWDFDGWVILPLDFFVLHTGYPTDNGVLDPANVTQMIWLLFGPALDDAYLMDEIGLVDDVDAALEKMEAVPAPSDRRYDMKAGATEVVKAADFQAIKDGGKKLTISVTDADEYLRYVWTFDGMDVTAPADFDPAVLFTSPDAAAIEALTEGTPFYLRFAQQGALPGRATLSVYVGEAYELYTALNLCRYSAADGIQVVDEGYRVGDEGFVELTLDSLADGFLLDNGESGGDGSEPEASDPSDITPTGVALSLLPLATGGLALLAALAVRKRKAAR